MSPAREMLECQTCGEPLRELSPAEVKAVAAQPENYIVDCRQCTVRIERAGWSP